MKTKRYAVAWHEENEAGTPVHVMGVEMFDTREKAQEWINKTVKEDMNRHAQQWHPDVAFLDEAMDDGIVHTYGNSQHCMYCIQEIEFEDSDAKELLDDVKKALGQSTYDSAKVADIQCIVDAFEEEHLPKRKYRVDVSFRPMICVHGIEATSESEAESIVERMIDDRTLKVKPEEIMGNILENVESVGDAEEDT